MKKTFNKNKIFLILILLAAFVLRFWKLDSYPALNADEAAIGYNAYSLIKTGLDEHGNPWPIHFQSFNDYKPGFYFYLVLPFVKILGLTEWAVRLPNAILGVATVWIVYLLVKKIFKEEKQALITSLLLAFSPWHIHFSRGGWEVGTATFLITTGLLFFLKGLGKSKYLFLSVFLFVLSLYTYHAARVVVPLLGFGLLFIYKKEIFKNLKPFLISGFIGFVFLMPLLFDFTKAAVVSRATGVGLFADSGPLSRVEQQRGEHQSIDSLETKLLHNKVVNYGLAFGQNWLRHFWGEFLFLSGDEIQRNKVPETGQLHLIELGFVVIGFFFILKNKINKNWQIVLWWLVISPVAAALTFQAPHALRAQNMVIPLEIISGFGLIAILRLLKSFKKQNLVGAFKLILGLLLLISFGRYLHMYWVHMAKEYPYSSQYGVKEMVSFVKENEDKYQKILVTDRYDQPYILLLFYTKYDPSIFQKNHVLTPRDSFGFSTVNHFDKYYFTSIKYDEARPENPNSLLVGTNEEIPDEANIVKDVYGTNGFLYFKIVAN